MSVTAVTTGTWADGTRGGSGPRLTKAVLSGHCDERLIAPRRTQHCARADRAGRFGTWGHQFRPDDTVSYTRGKHAPGGGIMKRLGWVLCATLALASCSDSDGDGSGGDESGGDTDCSTFTACGGEVIGTWNIETGCLRDFNPIEQICPEAVVDLSGVSFTGMYEYRADGNYSVTLIESGMIAFEVPGTCVMDFVDTCDELDADPTDCSGDIATSCQCVSSIVDTVAETGTFTTSGNTITLVPNGGEAEAGEYCVDGNVMKLRQTDERRQVTVALTRD